MRTVWNSLREQVRANLPEKSYSLWISPIRLLEESGDTLLLGCPNKFSLNWVVENYRGLLEEKLSQISEGRCKLDFKVGAPARKPLPTGPGDGAEQLVLPNLPASPRGACRPLNRCFTFERFVVGRCNEFAYSASRAFAQGDSIGYNPLLILANTGLGKSHLSQAVGHAMLEGDPGTRVHYVTAEDFVNEMICSLKNNSIQAFKDKYRRSCDALLLEGVHFLSGKEKMQMELGYTLDALANARKKIIFTSSLPPRDIPGLSRELASRLASGLITTLERPEYETRLKILENKAAEENLPVSGEILHLLAEKLTGDIRQIESALRCLKAKSELLKVKMDMDLAREVLHCLVPEQESASLDGIRSLVCRYFKVDPSALESKSRKAIHTYPRNVYVYLCRQHTAMTVEEIGKSINRNHSTVLYACEVMEQKMKADTKVKSLVEFLRKKLKDGSA
ncbi:MAG: chromosomal replication initiator protein DnaA [Thermodesulfobacteriota bacterium]